MPSTPLTPPPTPLHERVEIHAAIVLTCSRPPHLVERFGSVAADFSRMLSPFFTLLSLRVFDACNDQVPDVEDLEGVDLLLIPGSFHMVTDDKEWIRRLEEVIRKRQCWIFGVCFGMQLSCKAYGGQVTWNPKGVEVGVATVEFDPSMICDAGGKEMLTLLQSHDMHITVLPQDFKVLAWNEHTAVQAILSTKHRIMGVQFHPDFTADYFYHTRGCRKASLEQAEEVLRTTFDNEPFLAALQRQIIEFKGDKMFK